MKQILLAFGALVVAIVAFYWLSSRTDLKVRVVEPVSEVKNALYFEINPEAKSGEETEIKLIAKAEGKKISNFATNFTYDPSMVEIISGQVNTVNFDRASAANIDKEMGTVELFGDNGDKSKLETGDLVLATFKVKGIKKGNSMLYMSKRPEVYLWNGSEQIREDSYEMPNFKVNFL